MDRAHKILTIAITVLTGSIIYIIKNSDLEIITIAATLAIPICLTSIGLLIRPLKSYSAFVPGTPPKFLLVEKSIKGFHENEQIKNALLSECHNYQERIDYNSEINRERARSVDLAMYWLVALPLTLIFASGLKVIINLTLNN